MLLIVKETNNKNPKDIIREKDFSLLKRKFNNPLRGLAFTFQKYSCCSYKQGYNTYCECHGSFTTKTGIHYCGLYLRCSFGRSELSYYVVNFTFNNLFSVDNTC